MTREPIAVLLSTLAAGCGARTGLPAPEGIPEVSIAVGADNSCALSGGAVQCWGTDVYGMLGDGSVAEFRATPGPVTGLTSVVQLTVADTVTCARSADDSLTCWGGIAGNGTNLSAPEPVPILSGVAGLPHPGSSITNCAILLDGSVDCWGVQPLHGHCVGDFGTQDAVWSPEKVPALAGAAELALSWLAMCARWPDGSVQCCGANDWGELGDGSAFTRTTFAPVLGLPPVRALAAGYRHLCAELLDETWVCWGDDSHGELGDQPVGPLRDPFAVRHTVAVRDLPRGARLAAGLDFTCALLPDATVTCWGRNDEGELGDGTTRSRRTPAPVEGLRDVAELSLGQRHACARLKDERVLCWGENNAGQLGDGTTRSRLVPTPVRGLFQP